MDTIKQRIGEFIRIFRENQTKENLDRVYKMALRYARDLKDWAKELEEKEKENKKQLRDSDSTRKELEEKSDSLNRQQKEYDELKGKYEKSTGEISRLNESVSSITQELQQREKEREQLHNSCEEKDRQLKEQGRKYDELQRALDRVTGEKNSERQRADSLERQAEKVKVLQNLEQRMWPECIRVKELEAFRGEWAREILSSTPDRVLMLMFANIFAWSSAYSICEAGEGDDATEQTVTTSLFNFSKALFKWLSDHGHSYQEAHTIFDSIAGSLNTRMKGGKYKIEVPSLDSPYASKSMIPSRSGTSSGSVEAVEAWAILSNTNNYYINKASVKLTH